jgi:hypothetical protein
MISLSCLRLALMVWLLSLAGSVQMAAQAAPLPGDARTHSAPERMRLASAEADADARLIEELTRYAEAGSPTAQLKLGYRYLMGEGTERNPTLGIEWLEKAAERGQRDALVLLGTLYEKGVDVPLNHARAAALYRDAAEQGSPYAQYHLGKFYYLGLGVGESVQKAVMWLSRAAEAGEADSYALLAHIYLINYQNAAEAFRWRLKALEAGDEDAAKELLMAYFIAFSDPASYGLDDNLQNHVENAMAEMQRLSRQGDTLAQMTLGMFYRDGIGGIPRNAERARYWFQQAADAGDESAREALADFENN